MYIYIFITKLLVVGKLFSVGQQLTDTEHFASMKMKMLTDLTYLTVLPELIIYKKTRVTMSVNN